MTLIRPADEPRFDHGLRRQAIVRAVLTEIVQGRLPAGERLVTQALANRFGVSHTPIREALIELAGLGMVDLLPNRGAVVRRVTARNVRDVCQVRRALECEAVRAACGRIDPPELHALAAEMGPLEAENGFGPETVVRARTLDNRLHDRIAAAAGNTFLAAELARLKTLFRAYRDVAWEHEEARRDFHRIPVEAREHLAIVRALLAGDPTAAAEAMATHITSGEHYWSRVTAHLSGQQEPAAEVWSAGGSGAVESECPARRE
jgi:DNA-binding GntR family transcriptional regulator